MISAVVRVFVAPKGRSMSSGGSSAEDVPSDAEVPSPRADRCGTSADDAGHSCCDSCGQPLGFWAVDRMTGLLDRWGWDTEAPRALQHARESGHTSALLLIDLDRFKDVNDRFGHLAGDQLLRSVADVLRRCTREEHLVGRYGGHGGDEFLVLLPHIDLDGALDVAGHVRDGIRALVVDASVDAGTTVTIRKMTASIGISVCRPDEDADLATLVMDADTALREAKRCGRDQVRARVSGAGADSPPTARGTPAGATGRGGADVVVERRARVLAPRRADPAPGTVPARPHPQRQRGRASEARTLAFALSGLLAGASFALTLAITVVADHPLNSASPAPGTASRTPNPPASTPPATQAAPPPTAGPVPVVASTQRRPRGAVPAPPPRPQPAGERLPPGPWLLACPYMTSRWVSAQAQAMGCGG
jgi:diguanylate cyclase (GGDEF)-like protein